MVNNMKTLADGNNVSSDSYYYLLSKNEKDEWNTISKLFGKSMLNSLTLQEYIVLFTHFTDLEIKNFKNK